MCAMARWYIPTLAARWRAPMLASQSQYSREGVCSRHRRVTCRTRKGHGLGQQVSMQKASIPRVSLCVLWHGRTQGRSTAPQAPEPKDLCLGMVGPEVATPRHPKHKATHLVHASRPCLFDAACCDAWQDPPTPYPSPPPLPPTKQTQSNEERTKRQQKNKKALTPM